MKKLLLVGLLTFVGLNASDYPSNWNQMSGAQRTAWMRKNASQSVAPATVAPAPSASKAPAPSASNMAQLAQELASDSGRLANLLAAFEVANNLPGGNAADGRADLNTLNSL
ncbi:hypothetical protein KBD08_03890 [Candidatus Babeliales bacterium]|nr:hypothetical protein [Candidatus Babeliales bacterium]